MYLYKFKLKLCNIILCNNFNFTQISINKSFVMKTFTLILSTSLLFFFSYVFFTNFKSSNEINYLLFMILLLVSISICIISCVICVYQLIYSKKRSKTLHYNSYSERRIKNSEFDKSLSQLNF